MDDDFNSFFDYYFPEFAEGIDENIQQKEPVVPPTRVIFVCMICLRQYDLEQDLRGHMTEYHKFVPIEQNVPMSYDNNVPEYHELQNITHDEQSFLEAIEMLPSISASEAEEIFEIKPVPFTDFRLLLRRHMNMKCTASNTCAYRFETPEKLDIHMKCHLKMASTFKCCFCSVDLQNWRRCSAHLWKSHNMDIDLLKCPVCDFTSYASALVWRHMRVHKKWRPRVLRSLKAVKQKRLLAQQQAAKEPESEEEEPNPPPKRNKYYSEKTCPICDRKFVNGKTLSKHIKTVHNKIKPFICNVCGKKTARKASLIIHMRQHTGEKPLQCKSCKFSTRDPSVLYKHQMRHNRENVKFKCSLCDYSCIQANAYKRHLRLSHPETYKNIACDLCSFATISPEKLHQHKEDHRKGLIDNNDEDSMPTPSMVEKTKEDSVDCFLPLDSNDSMPHDPAVDTGGVTIPAPSEDSQFPTNF